MPIGVSSTDVMAPFRISGTSAVGPGPSAARRSSDFNISIEPGPGTPDHGTLIHAEPDVGQKRHSYVGVENMSAIKRAQVGNHLYSACCAPCSALSAFGVDGCRWVL